MMEETITQQGNAQRTYHVTPQLITASRKAANSAAGTVSIILVGGTGSFVFVSLVLGMYLITTERVANDLLFSLLMAGAIGVIPVFLAISKSMSSMLKRSSDRKVRQALHGDHLVDQIANDFNVSADIFMSTIVAHLTDNQKNDSNIQLHVVGGKSWNQISRNSQISVSNLSPVIREYSVA